MQKGKISKIFDAIALRATFGRLKSGDRYSYKDYLFLEILDSDNSIAYQVLATQMQEWQIFQLRQQLQQSMLDSPTLESQQPEEFYRSYLAHLSTQYALEQITSLHAVVDIAEDSSTALSKLLPRYNVSLSAMRGELLRRALASPLGGDDDSDATNLTHGFKSLAVGRISPTPQSTPKHPLDKFGRNVTLAARSGQIDVVVGREREIDRVIEILSRRKKNNPILIGEAGVGKSAVIEGLALRMAAGDVPYTLRGKQLFSLDVSSLVAGTKFRGEFEERMQQLLESLSASRDTIIFIDEIHTIVGAGSTQGSLDTANILKPALARGELQVVGATTLDEYRTDIESDAALERRFQRVMVEPTTRTQTLEILRRVAPQYESHHNVRYTPEALEACVSLSDRYIADRYFPDKAIDILDEVGARAHIKAAHLPAHLKELESAVATAKSTRHDSLEKLNYEVATQARITQLGLDVKLRQGLEKWQREVERSPIAIGVEAVEAVISSITGVPIERLSTGEQERLRGLAAHLSDRVVGQCEAVEKLARSIYLSRSGLKPSLRPIGVFMFVGPTGVGKTLLAKELSRWMFDERRGLIRIDMSEYSQPHNVSRLIGSPPGYVGYGQGGQLTEAVRRQPYAVVLFDEIEKAHTDIFNTMLQIFDEGSLTDGTGRKVDFSNTIIILTSNVGSHSMSTSRNRVGYSTDESQAQQTAALRGQYQKALAKSFAPEFLNRIDDIVIFDSLSPDDITKIIELELDGLHKRLEALGYKLRITDGAKKSLAQLGYSVEYGARALKRLLSDKVEAPLSRLIIDSKAKVGDTIVVEKSPCTATAVILKVA